MFIHRWKFLFHESYRTELKKRDKEIKKTLDKMSSMANHIYELQKNNKNLKKEMLKIQEKAHNIKTWLQKAVTVFNRYAISVNEVNGIFEQASRKVDVNLRKIDKIVDIVEFKKNKYGRE